MRVLAVENYAGTHLGLVGRALAEADAAVDLRRMYDGDPLPETSGGYDALVVLGGGQNALADDAHPYLPALAALTARFGADDKPVLGICLGAQIVARGHGATNVLGRPLEIGWLKVTPTDAGRADPVVKALGDGAPLFHWHTDTFTLPPGAVHLASSAATPNQAFRIGRAVYGIQFHFEADRTVVDAWTADYPHLFATEAPDWPTRHARDRATLGAQADATGLQIARAFVGLIT